MSFWKSAADALSPIFRPAGGTIAGVDPATWSSPQQPIKPLLPPGLGVRSWDFQPGINLQFTPRGDTAINFKQLRNVADSFDLCRLMIETSKDQIVDRPWLIRVKTVPGETKKDRLAREATNPNIAKITAALSKPDGVHSWPIWIRMWLDQLLVYDAPCIYPVRNVLNDCMSLRLVSGSTITPLLDNQGFIPQPPEPAYQQIILGLPTSNLTAGSKPEPKGLTADQLIYSPRNPRVDSRWGFGPVEQIITTLQIASNWQYSVKAAFTEGNVPEGMMPMPESWTMSQIKDFQNWFDGLLAGNVGRKRRMIAIPATQKGVQFSKESTIVDPVVNEYLIRVVAYAFSISPQNLLKQVNRGTAKESSDVAQMEGREPIMKHIESVVNLDIIQGVFGITDVEFAYADEREMDTLKQAQTDDIYVGKVKTINEARNDLGLDPRPEPEADMLGEFTPQGFIPLGQQIQQGGDDSAGDGPASKVQKKTLKSY